MKNSSHIAALDGIRFVAVSLVLIDHWSGDALGFPASYLGVCLFFVLSGFLITRILIHAKQKDTQLGRGHGFSLRQFYIRRTIRIFPLYYLTLAILFVLNVPPIREKIWWFVTYNTNNYIAYFQQWLGTSDHLWSLAVEEQFYIFFPFLIFFLPFRRIPTTLTLFVLLAVGLRWFFYWKGVSWVTPYVLMFTCLDAFGIGGLLAYAYYTENKAVKSFFTSWWPLVLGVAFYVLIIALGHKTTGHNFFTVVWLRLAESVLSVAIIGRVVWGLSAQPSVAEKGLFSFLTWPVAIYLGKISYGIYLFHNYLYNPYHLTPSHPMAKFFAQFPLLNNSVPLRILFLYALVVALASLSWRFFEKPINALKDKFTY